MADPVSWIAIAGAVAGGVGAIQQGQAANRAAKENAQLIERDAAFRQEQITYEEARLKERTRRLIGQQRGAPSGVDVNLGSPAALQLETTEDAELERLALRYGGNEDLIRSKLAAGQQRQAGRDAVTGSVFKAGSSILTGVSSAGELFGDPSTQALDSYGAPLYGRERFSI